MTATSTAVRSITFDFDAMSVWIGSHNSNNPAMISRGEFGAVAVPRHPVPPRASRRDDDVLRPGPHCPRVPAPHPGDPGQRPRVRTPRLGARKPGALRHRRRARRVPQRPRRTRGGRWRPSEGIPLAVRGLQPQHDRRAAGARDRLRLVLLSLGLHPVLPTPRRPLAQRCPVRVRRERRHRRGPVLLGSKRLRALRVRHRIHGRPEHRVVRARDLARGVRLRLRTLHGGKLQPRRFTRSRSAGAIG